MKTRNCCSNSSSCDLVLHRFM